MGKINEKIDIPNRDDMVVKFSTDIPCALSTTPKWSIMDEIYQIVNGE